MSENELYKRRIFEYFRKNEFLEKIDNPDFHADEQGLICADKVKISGLICENKIKKLMVTVNGCIIATACANILAENILGQSIEFAKTMEEDFFISKIAQIPVQESRRQCATLALKVLKTALEKI